MWLRALLLCDDVRFEIGGTMTLVGVLTDRILVEPGDGEVIVPRLAIYSVVAGLTGVAELTWRLTLTEVGREPSAPIVEGGEHHDPDADEHRLVNIVSPLTLPGPGPYRLAVELEAGRARHRVDHHFILERAPPGAAE